MESFYLQPSAIQDEFFLSADMGTHVTPVLSSVDYVTSLARACSVDCFNPSLIVTLGMINVLVFVVAFKAKKKRSI